MGFGDAVVAIQGTKDTLFEGGSTYHLKGKNAYLTLIEAFGPTGNRYYRSFVASTLEGTWVPLADSWTNPFAGKTNVTFDGGTAWTNDISHGEMIRDGYDQNLEIDPANLQFLYQGVDPSQTSRRVFAAPVSAGPAHAQAVAGSRVDGRAGVVRPTAGSLIVSRALSHFLPLPSVTIEAFGSTFFCEKEDPSRAERESHYGFILSGRARADHRGNHRRRSHMRFQTVCAGAAILAMGMLAGCNGQIGAATSGSGNTTGSGRPATAPGAADRRGRREAASRGRLARKRRGGVGHGG